MAHGGKPPPSMVILTALYRRVATQLWRFDAVAARTGCRRPSPSANDVGARASGAQRLGPKRRSLARLDRTMCVSSAWREDVEWAAGAGAEALLEHSSSSRSKQRQRQRQRTADSADAHVRHPRPSRPSSQQAVPRASALKHCFLAAGPEAAKPRRAARHLTDSGPVWADRTLRGQQVARSGGA